MSRRGRRTESGAETLELVASLPLLVLVSALILQGVVLVRQQVQAESDARQLARSAVMCGPVLSAEARLRLVDPVAADDGAAVTVKREADTGLTRVTVSLAPQAVISGLRLGVGGFTPHASVAMRDEPC
ncbi:MAG: hypothetical protein NVSMB29_06650 [Candidatus Dormibacteria bacterium]